MSGNYYQYGKNYLAYNWNDDGPYIFFENDSLLSVNYIKGNKENGFYVDNSTITIDSLIKLRCYYPIDSTSFFFDLHPTFDIPKNIYNDAGKILAISDIESNYKTFRDFLINSKVIDKDLNWIFGKNHLVLVGDFIDRSYFTTQVLWFIYKLEQDAKSKGGTVHYILGNHEIMNMQGNHRYAKSKYNVVATILDKKQFQLYDTTSFLGRWMNSKNTLEVINGYLFVHGGITPEIPDINLNINQMNETIRKNYYKPYYPKKDGNKITEMLTSSKKSPYWYRGYFKEDLSQDDINKGLEKFNAKGVIVGHTVQSKIKRKYEGKVIAIDVKHPLDYYKYFPKRKSEGLLIENDNLYRVLKDGTTKELK